MKSVNEKRLSNFELLRILAMLMIVLHHFAIHGGFDFSVEQITINRLWIQFIQMGGKIGFNIFVLISGYFLVDTPKIKLDKVFKLWGALFFYSITIYIVFGLLKISELEIRGILFSFFPVTFLQWGFASSYFVLYLIFPFINILIYSLDKKTYQKFICITSLCWCIIPTFTGQEFESNNLVWFTYLYMLAGYIKIWRSDKGKKNYVDFCIVAILVILTYASVIVLDIIGLIIPSVGIHSTHFYGAQQLPILLISLFIFEGFRKWDLKYNKIINVIASATFGVYLIHDNSIVRAFLWEELVKNAMWDNNRWLIIYTILVTLVIYIICTVIELIRIVSLERLYMQKVRKVVPIVNSIIAKLLRYIEKLG